MESATPRPKRASSRDEQVVRSRGARVVYELVWRASRALFRFFYRLDIRGEQNIPREGALLVVANHQSHLDPPAVAMAFRKRPLFFLARGGLFKNRVFGWLIRTLNSIPIGEGKGETAGIRVSLEALDAGRALLVFPEGSRSPDGELKEFKRGMWLLVSRARCDVLPVAIEGAFGAWPRHRPRPSLFGHRIRINIGVPVSATDLLAFGPDAGLAHLAAIVDGLRAELLHPKD
ncbi:MAG: 1-acyl-sn-glycerol-3-phosphate acyltransferase [Phycisphaerales bacterium]|nr:1-acyl-sn-glycerol-3-phosphate acyltransferase [Phycisphaerales bacterium]